VFVFDAEDQLKMRLQLILFNLAATHESRQGEIISYEIISAGRRDLALRMRIP